MFDLRHASEMLALLLCHLNVITVVTDASTKSEDQCHEQARQLALKICCVLGGVRMSHPVLQQTPAIRRDGCDQGMSNVNAGQ
jgi:hypothetical protein